MHTQLTKLETNFILSGIVSNFLKILSKTKNERNTSLRNNDFVKSNKIYI